MKSLVWVIACSFLLATLSAQETSVKSGQTFMVTCHFKNDVVAASVLDTVEQSFAHAERVLGTKHMKSKGLLDVHVWATQAEFDTAAGTAPEATERRHSFTKPADKTIHALLFPESSSEALLAVGLPIATRRNLTYETARLHQHFGPQAMAVGPRWLWNGAAMYASEAAIQKFNWSPGLERDPGSSTWIAVAQDLLRQDKLPTLLEILKGTLSDEQRPTERALHFLMWSFFMSPKTRTAFEATLVKIAKLKVNAELDGAALKLMQTALKLDSLVGEFRPWLKGLMPQWLEPYPMLQSHADGWVQISSPTESATAYSRQEPKDVNYTISGKVKILAGKEKQANILLGDGVRGFIVLTLVSGTGATVIEYLYKDQRSDQLEFWEVDDLEIDKTIPFELTVRQDSMQVSLNGRALGTVGLRGHDMSGPWGLGTYQSSAALWSDVKLK